MSAIHFICRGRLNLRQVEPDAWESGNWDLTPEEAATVVGGMIYLHEGKSAASYIGGRIESFREVKISASHARRIVFRFASLKEGGGAQWKGQDHALAWTSGIVESDSE